MATYLFETITCCQSSLSFRGRVDDAGYHAAPLRGQGTWRAFGDHRKPLRAEKFKLKKRIKL